MQKVLDWLDTQMSANNPSLVGMSGAVRMTEAAASLARPDEHGNMAFGLAFERTLVPHATPLVERAKTMLEAYLGTLSAGDREVLRQSVGAKLATLGLMIDSTSQVATHQVVLRYPLVHPAVVDDVDERPMSEAEKRCWGGVQPAEGFDVFDLLENVPWIVDATVTLEFDEGELWCDLVLLTEREPSPANRDALMGPISCQIWESGWSMNLEWDVEKAMQSAGLSEEYFVNTTVSEEPKSLTVNPL